MNFRPANVAHPRQTGMGYAAGSVYFTWTTSMSWYVPLVKTK
jgi:hypothetical protein